MGPGREQRASRSTPVLAAFGLLLLLLLSSLFASLSPSLALASGRTPVPLPSASGSQRSMDLAVRSLEMGAGPAAGVPWTCGAPTGGSVPCGASGPRAVLAAGGAATAWQQITSTSGTPPSARDGSGLTYDATDGYVLLFGGVNGAGTTYGDDTWKFEGGSWTNITATVGTAPPGRVSPSMAYDPADGYVVLYGGLALNGPETWFDDFSDTWTFAGGHWTNITSTAGTPPTARFSMAFAYDWTDHELVGFGGEYAEFTTLGSTITGATFTMNQQTWAFSGGVWKDLTGAVGTPPSARAGSSLVYDPADGYLLLYGGLWEKYTGSSSDPVSGYEMADTWSFVGGTWTNRTASVTGAPGDLALSGIAWDANAAAVVIFGGCVPPVGSSCPVSNVTWTYRADTWTNVTARMSVAPAPRATTAMTNDTKDGYVLLFGGSCGSNCATGDTWTETGLGSNVHAITLSASPSTCGPVQFNGVAVASGSSVADPNGQDLVAASPCPSHLFEGWNVSGGLTLSSPSALSSSLSVWGPGSLTAWFVSPLTVLASSGSSTVGLGQSTTLTATAYGGVPTYSYLWALNGTNTSTTQNPWTLAFPHAGTYTYSAWATDNSGAKAVSTSVAISVLAYTPPPLTQNLSLTSYYAPTGSTIVATSTTAGGTISTYLWLENGSSASGCSSASNTCSFPFPHGGTYTISVTATDSLGRKVTNASEVTVYSDFSTSPPPPMSVVLSVNSTQATVGEGLTFSAVISGGVGPYHGYVLWDNITGNSSPLKATTSGTTDILVYAFTQAGVHEVRLWAFDAAGVAAQSNDLTITVAPVPSGSSSPPPPPNSSNFWSSSIAGIPVLLLVALPVVVVVAVAALVIARRGRSRPPPEPSAPYGYEGAQGGWSPAGPAQPGAGQGYGGYGGYGGQGPQDVRPGPPPGYRGR